MYVTHVNGQIQTTQISKQQYSHNISLEKPIQQGNGNEIPLKKDADGILHDFPYFALLLGHFLYKHFAVI